MPANAAARFNVARGLSGPTVLLLSLAIAPSLLGSRSHMVCTDPQHSRSVMAGGCQAPGLKRTHYMSFRTWEPARAVAADARSCDPPTSGNLRSEAKTAGRSRPRHTKTSELCNGTDAPSQGRNGYLRVDNGKDHFDGTTAKPSTHCGFFRPLRVPGSRKRCPPCGVTTSNRAGFSLGTTLIRSWKAFRPREASSRTYFIPGLARTLPFPLRPGPCAGHATK